MGGSLANPVPRLLGPGWTLFAKYPYLLPSLVSGLFGLAAFVIGLVYIPEVGFLLPTAASS